MLRARVTIRKWPSDTDLEAKAVSQLKRFVGAIFDGVVKRSPVYTGSFRASWLVSFGTPSYNEVNGTNSLIPLAPPTFVWPDNYRLGQSIYVTNGQPYAQRLEYGWSQQAPQGVIRVTLASVRLV